MKRLVLATSNEAKAHELRALLPLIAVETLKDHPGIVMPEETGATFTENAIQKAEHVAGCLGVPALADDSGLVVDALGGAPGVHSARYAEGTDGDRTQKLLSVLEGVPDERRAARFVCALAFQVPGQPVLVVEARLEGRIGHRPKGSAGFGYDPVFLLAPDHARTTAELSLEEKNLISHRAKALLALMPNLLAHFSP